MIISEIIILSGGLFFLILSVLHAKRGIRKSSWTGYSTSGTLLFGIAFTLFGISFLMELNSIWTAVLYFIFVCVGVYFEKKEKQKITKH